MKIPFKRNTGTSLQGNFKVYHSIEMMIPQLTFSLKITEVLLMFDMKIYISIEIVIVPMVGPSQLKLEY